MALPDAAVGSSTLESLLDEVLKLDQSMTAGELVSIRDTFTGGGSASPSEREKYEERLASIYEMLRLEKAYLARMRECCRAVQLPKPKSWVRVNEIIDSVEADVQWKEDQLLGEGSLESPVFSSNSMAIGNAL
ncbi:zinc finger, C2HC-type containing [Perkinsus chesapeaki]|uniref:Zinc finger, C2HC-type containing n=1 Tax=Perkinsus chesapeaki TaxID=330153 RepID=A0A7J6M954_PERCH|nr:zinc finger, C2HC-type containing [Perkinsus chesapeaki]